MRANENVVLVGEDVVLVPYCPEHVEKYHQWMTSEELRTLTASEPLTLKEEYEMQQKWRLDEDKLTFIVLAREGNVVPANVSLEPLSTFPMIGDVNLFLKGLPGDEDFEAEVEAMIAEPSYRRRGLASAAIEVMLTYATSISASMGAHQHPLPIPRDRLVARIGERNTPSIRLFEKLGFTITKRVAVFEEVELRFTGQTASWRRADVHLLGVDAEVMRAE